MRMGGQARQDRLFRKGDLARSPAAGCGVECRDRIQGFGGEWGGGDSVATRLEVSMLTREVRRRAILPGGKG